MADDNQKLNPAAVLKSLRGDYDESTGYTGNPNSNSVLQNYFGGGGSLQALTGAMTGDNGESIIPQNMLTSALNQYYGTLNPASITSPEAFQAATGNPFGLNTAGTSGLLPNAGLSVPTFAPEGYVPFNPATDIAQVQSMGGSVINPNDILTQNGLTYTPRSNLNIPQGGDFLSKFGPALAAAAVLGPAEMGALGGAGAGGLVGGASGAETAGAVGGGSLATGSEGLVGGGLSEFAPVGGAMSSGLSTTLGSLPDTVGAGAGGAETLALGGPVAPTGIPLPAASGLDATLSTLPEDALGGGELSGASGIADLPTNITLPSGAQASFVGGATPELDVQSSILNGPAVAGGTSGIGNIISEIPSGLKDFIENNWKSVLPMAITGLSALRQNSSQIPELSNLEQLAGNSAAGQQLALQTAENLVPTVSTGQLPPGAQTGINNALKDAQTAIRAKYANLGLSGSTMETQELNAAKDRAEAMTFQQANQLTQTGLQALGMTGNAGALYNEIMNAQLEQDQNLQQALANFAAAGSGGARLTIG